MQAPLSLFAGQAVIQIQVIVIIIIIQVIITIIIQVIILIIIIINGGIVFNCVMFKVELNIFKSITCGMTQNEGKHALVNYGEVGGISVLGPDQ